MQLAHENRRVWGWVGVSVRVSRLGSCPGATSRHGRGRFLKTQPGHYTEAACSISKLPIEFMTLQAPRLLVLMS